MSQINTIYPLIAANNNCKTKPYEPSFKSVLPQFVESQELCSKEASKAISEQIKVLIDLNSQEHFLDKNLICSILSQILKICILSTYVIFVYTKC